MNPPALSVVITSAAFLIIGICLIVAIIRGKGEGISLYVICLIAFVTAFMIGFRSLT